MLVLATSKHKVFPQPRAGPRSTRPNAHPSLPALQGLPQWISLRVNKLTPITHVAITFQGGFSGTTAGVYLASDRPGKASEGVDLGLVFGGKIYPKDSNGVSRRYARVKSEQV